MGRTRAAGEPHTPDPAATGTGIAGIELEAAIDADRTAPDLDHPIPITMLPTAGPGELVSRDGDELPRDPDPVVAAEPPVPAAHGLAIPNEVESPPPQDERQRASPDPPEPATLRALAARAIETVVSQAFGGEAGRKAWRALLFVVRWFVVGTVTTAAVLIIAFIVLALLVLIGAMDAPQPAQTDKTWTDIDPLLTWLLAPSGLLGVGAFAWLRRRGPRQP